MNEQIKKDRELLDGWEAEYRAGFSWTGDKYSKAFEMLVPLVQNLLAAQKRVAQQEEKQKIAKLVTGFITDRMGDILYTDLQELERLILTDNN